MTSRSVALIVGKCFKGFFPFYISAISIVGVTYMSLFYRCIYQWHYQHFDDIMIKHGPLYPMTIMGELANLY